MNTMRFSDEGDSLQATSLSSQLEHQLLALQAGAPMPGERQRQSPSLGQETTLRRVLLIAQGPLGRAAAEAAVAATERWLPPPHPLASVVADRCSGDSPAEGRTLVEAVRAAAEQLASRELAAALLQRGCQLDRHAEFHIWLLVDLEPSGTAEAAAPAPNPAAAVTLLQSVEREIWHTLRLRTLPHALLLARPQAGANVARWATALQQANIADVCLCGSVNLNHQSWREEEWIRQAGLALAGLCWGSLPSHAEREQGGSICILGAAAWASSLPYVRQWLGLRSALAAVRCLSEDAPQEDPQGVRQARSDCFPTSAESPAAESAIDVMEWSAQLHLRVPDPLPLKSWSGRQPAWATLPQLSALLAGEEQQEEARAAINQRQARMAWLDAAVDRWTAQFETEKRAALMPPGGLPTPDLWQTKLDSTAQRLSTAQQVVDEALERAGEAVENLLRAEQAASERINEVTREFRAQSVWSGLWALLQFWRWPALLWAWFQLLPQRCQALYTAQAQRRGAAWREANWHLLRQLLLALQGSTRHAAQDNRALRSALAELAAVLRGRMAAIEQTAQLSPWTAETLEDLWQAAESGGVAERLIAYLEGQPLPTWTATDPRAQADALVGALAGPEPALEGWTALECLLNGLERAEIRQRDPLEHLLARKPLRQPFVWLDEQRQNALPLWPKPSLRPEVSAQNWLLLPPSCFSTARPPNRTAVAKLQWWLDTLPEPMEAGVCNGEALVFLRWASVAIADLENEE